MAKRAQGKIDAFVNRAIATVTMSAANTLTFVQLRFGMGIFTGTALIINAIDWLVVSLDEIVTVSDELFMALTNRDDLSDLMPNNMNVLAPMHLHVSDHGTAASGEIIKQPFRSDFSGLPGEGLIIPANPLFLGVGSGGLTNPATVHAVIYYVSRELTDADYVELVQSLIPVNV